MSSTESPKATIVHLRGATPTVDARHTGMRSTMSTALTNTATR